MHQEEVGNGTRAPDYPGSPREPNSFSETASSESFEQEMKALEESGEDTQELRRRYLLTRFWQTARGYWSKRGHRFAWVLSGMLLLIVLVNVATAYGMNLWNRAIFDSLDRKEASAV